VVTLYATLGVDSIKYGIEQAECTQVITSSDQLPKFEVIKEKHSNTLLKANQNSILNN